MKKTNHFNSNGYSIIRNVLSSVDVKNLITKIDYIFENAEMNIHTLKGIERNGVVRNKELWNIIYHPKILENVKNIIGDEIKFLQHNSVLRSFSATGWHRDSVDKTYKSGNDWNLNEPYLLVRVAIYLEDSQYNKFRLGFIKKSNTKKKSFLEKDHSFTRFIRALEKKTAKYIKRNYFFPFLGPCHYPVLKQGDIVIFDPRIFHRGTTSVYSKHAVIFAFGKENSHFRRHFLHFFNDPPGYSKIPGSLRKELAQRNLLADINKS